ncbi:MAG: S8 family serine peptidase [Alphaproteobacteria bacterium]|nr:S8 family serine peptidase [Alphaproteobacteria bacterium]
MEDDYGTPPSGFDLTSKLTLWGGSALTAIGRVDAEPYASSPFIVRSFTPTDSLFGNQWHLLNTGQGGGTPGIDINVTGVWDDYTGAGVRVGVVDDGVQFTHHDLNDNYNPSGQFDYTDNNDPDPTPTASDPHGTAVAGLIAAENNGVGSVGVAFDASITAFRILSGGLTESDLADVYNRHAVELDVSNNSWGFNSDLFFFGNLDAPNFDSVGTAIENAAANGRGGLGTVMLWAAGNDRVEGQDVNYHGFQNARETIAVAAINNHGDIASYSTPGAAILVGAPSNGGSLAITTTDQLGSNGYSFGDYTSIFGGTSAATPITSGVVALMLEANPGLGYRDVQEILGYSARQVDVTDPGWAFNGADNWNGGGLHSSHDFGFGLVDAHAAVRLAETWTAQSTSANEALVSGSSTPNLATIGNGIITDTIVIGGGVEIDHVEVELNLAHSWIGDLVITLTSPDGTESVLVDRPGVTSTNSLGSSQDNIFFTLSSTNHWGETGVGSWTLEIEDFRVEESGVLTDWTLNLFGDVLNNDDVYIYTNEFANFAADASRQNLSDTTGDDIINAAAITTNSVIDLNDGADSTLAGNTLSIAAGTVIEDAYAGDGNDSLIGNAADNLLSGGRGDDTLLGGVGNDTLIGGVGDDVVVVGTNNGNDVIDGFVAGAGSIDRIDLSARSDINDFNELLAIAADNGVDTTISFGNGDSLTLTDVLTSELDTDDFILPASGGGVELLSDNFDDGDFAGWSVVDQGVTMGPSAWSVVNQEVNQSTNIYTFSADGLYPDNREGTVLFWNDATAQSWQDYTVDTTFRSTDDDGIGVVFYYTDENNYYKVDFDQQRSFSKLFQVQGGVETTLASVSGPGYAIGVDTALSVTVSGSEITVLRDGADVFGGPVQGGALTGGTVGLYSWANTGANFDDVVVTGNGPAASAFSVAATDSAAIGTDGDDVFVAADTSFGRLDGGSGFDTLRFEGADQSFDLSALAGDRINSMEAFDITGTGNNLLVLSTELASAATHGVNALTGVENSLIIDGDAGDTVDIGSGWSEAGTASIGNEGYSVYVSEDKDAQVFVNAAVEVTSS